MPSFYYMVYPLRSLRGDLSPSRIELSVNHQQNT